MSELKYKEGDKVRIKSLDWYNRHAKETEVNWQYFPFSCSMTKYCGQIMTISIVRGCSYSMIEDDYKYAWTDEMIECKVEEETKNLTAASISDDPYTVTYDSPSMNDSISKNIFYNEMILPDGCVFKDENGNVINATKIVLEKKKKEYPKTYEECCKVLGLNSEITDSELLFYYPLKCGDYTTIRLPEMEKFEKFIQLYLCRNAYWKIYGEEFNWDNALYYIYTDEYGNVIENDNLDGRNCVLAFPNKASRDAFRENFGPDIKICKELL